MMGMAELELQSIFFLSLTDDLQHPSIVYRRFRLFLAITTVYAQHFAEEFAFRAFLFKRDLLHLIRQYCRDGKSDYFCMGVDLVF